MRPQMRTLIIGEMGSTPEGNLGTMKRLVDVAADCKADCVKNQWVSNAQTMCDRRHAPEYLGSYRLLQYPLEWHAELRKHANVRGLQYACTAYIPGDPTLLAPFVDYLKVSSFESEDGSVIWEVLDIAGRKRKPHPIVIVSFGMSDCGACFSGLEKTTRRLHCVSSYPAPLASLNLAVIADEPDSFEGFSDHSHDVRVGAWAIAAGASILETHFRLDDCDPANKDYAVAFTPAEFKTYIKNVRDCEAALGDGVKRVQECEQEMERFKVRT